MVGRKQPARIYKTRSKNRTAEKVAGNEDQFLPRTFLKTEQVHVELPRVKNEAVDSPETYLGCSKCGHCEVKPQLPVRSLKSVGVQTEDTTDCMITKKTVDPIVDPETTDLDEIPDPETAEMKTAVSSLQADQHSSTIGEKGKLFLLIIFETLH